MGTVVFTFGQPSEQTMSTSGFFEGHTAALCDFADLVVDDDIAEPGLHVETG